MPRKIRLDRVREAAPPTSPNVFIAWSGDRSRKVAVALKEWIPKVIQAAHPWMSETDIPRGSLWQSVLSESLRVAGFGIVCVTPENQDRTWLNFEAGALARDLTRICPYLFGLGTADLAEPLAMFNAAEAKKTHTLELIRTLNDGMSAPVNLATLESSFEAFWPGLQVTLDSIPATETPVKRSEGEVLEDVLVTMRELLRRQGAPGAMLSGLVPTFPTSQYPYVRSTPFNEMVSDIATYIVRRTAPLEDKSVPYLGSGSGRVGYGTVNDILTFIVNALPEQTGSLKKD